MGFFIFWFSYSSLFNVFIGFFFFWQEILIRGVWCKTILSVIFQFRTRKVSLVVYMKSKFPENHTDLLQDTDKLDHRKLYLVHLTTIGIRTHNFSGDIHWLLKVSANLTIIGSGPWHLCMSKRITTHIIFDTADKCTTICFRYEKQLDKRLTITIKGSSERQMPG